MFACGSKRRAHACRHAPSKFRHFEIDARLAKLRAPEANSNLHALVPSAVAADRPPSV